MTDESPDESPNGARPRRIPAIALAVLGAIALVFATLSSR